MNEYRYDISHFIEFISAFLKKYKRVRSATKFQLKEENVNFGAPRLPLKNSLDTRTKKNTFL